MVKSYCYKAVISGNVVEIYEYEKDVLTGYKDTKKESKGRQVEANSEDKKKNREKVVSRARKDIRRLVNSNYISGRSKFVTLTFAENIQDIKAANYEFKKFVQRLSYNMGYKLSYLVVIEFQKRGAIHFHVLFFNLDYIKVSELGDMWGNGFVKINRIKHVDNVGAYICKYLSKDNDDERLLGEKMWFRSRGLKSPVEIKEKEAVENLLQSLPPQNLTYENEFNNEFNSIKYKQYNLNIT